eukprot:m.13188 g.13188  ORF g.13188 m.13188 type:complete len:354 (-) comp7275_c0_seq1:23-1084(-)
MPPTILLPFKPPSWATKLLHIPQKRLQLAMKPTPIHRWRIPNLPNNARVYIKRDDMTGSTLGGNKVRKLDFLLAEAKAQGVHNIITCGSLQSNHARATAVAARELGINTHLVLRSDTQDPSAVSVTANLLLDRLVGAEIHLAPREPYATGLLPRMQALQKQLREEKNEESMLIPAGGSNTTGLWGYLEAYDELLHQREFTSEGPFSDIVLACGSGGSVAGLALANHLHGAPNRPRIHGIPVCDDADYFYNHIDELLTAVLPENMRIGARDIVSIIDGYKGLGYGRSAQEERDFIQNVGRYTGIVLDPVYTGKAALGLHTELFINPQRFQGDRILFIHTGGLLGDFDGTMKPTL